MKVKLILLLMGLFFTYSGIVYAYTTVDKEFLDIYNQNSITDEEVKQLAIEKGIIPQNIEDFDKQKEKEAKNSIILWLIMERKDKIAVIDKVREIYKQNGVIIGNPSPYYVNEINLALYNSILNGDIDSSKRKGAGIIFKTIAIMDGDYNDGRDKVEACRELLGKELFEFYKKHYPEKYQYLIKNSDR